MPSERPSSVELVNDFLDHLLNDLNRSRNTVYCYQLDCRTLLTTLGRTHLLDATTDDLRRWLRRRSAEPAPATMKREVMVLRTLFKYLIEQRRLTLDNPAKRIHAPTVHNENPHPAPLDDWRALWDSDLDDAERVAFGLAYFCGLRRSEVTALTPVQLTFEPEGRLVDLRRKGGNKVTHPWASCAALYRQRAPEHGDTDLFVTALHRLALARVGCRNLLPWADQRSASDPDRAINPTRFNHHLRRALLRAGALELAFGPHSLRHSFATNMLNMGVALVNVSRLMGHTSVTVTQRYVFTAEDPLAHLLAPDLGVGGVASASRWT